MHFDPLRVVSVLRHVDQWLDVDRRNTGFGRRQQVSSLEISFDDTGRALSGRYGVDHGVGPRRNIPAGKKTGPPGSQRTLVD